MDDIYTYVVDLPPGIHEFLAPCADGFTLYLSASDSQERRIRSYRHALRHIESLDFGKESADSIEADAHKKG